MPLRGFAGLAEAAGGLVRNQRGMWRYGPPGNAHFREPVGVA